MVGGLEYLVESVVEGRIPWKRTSANASLGNTSLLVALCASWTTSLAQATSSEGWADERDPAVDRVYN